MKKVIFVLALSLIFNTSNAQELLVAQNFYLEKLSVDNEKNIIVTGIFSGTFDFDFSSNSYELTTQQNYSEKFIAKYDSLLNFKWVFSFGKGINEINNILTDDFGDIYISGFSYDSADFDPSVNTFYLPLTNNSYEAVGFIAKYDKNGNFQWAIKPESKSKINNISNNFVYADYYNRLIKYNSAGNEIWNVKTDMSIFAFDNKSKFYFIADTIQNYYIQRPLPLSTIDTMGNVQFIRTLTQSSNSKFKSERLFLADNKLIITGEYWGDIDMDPGSSSCYIHDTVTALNIIHGNPVRLPVFKDFIAAYDLDGNLIFVKDFKDNITIPYVIKSDFSGNIFTVGTFSDSINMNFNGSNRINLTSPGTASYLAEYDSSFSFISAVKLTELDKIQFGVHNIISNLVFDTYFTVMSGGYYNLNLEQKNIYLNNPAFYIAIYKDFQASPLGISNFEKNNSLMRIYPNPSYDNITIEIPGIPVQSTFSIINSNGQEVIKQTVKNNKTQINISHLSSGVYFVKLLNDKNVEVRKIIKK